MKAVVAILLLAAVASAVPSMTNEDLYESFINWKVEHGKEYAHALEHSTRFANFKQNVALINHLNRQSRSAKFALNKFADMSQEEFAATYLHPIPNIEKTTQPLSHSGRDYPEEWDWRQHGAVTAVKDQGSCGSCWAFSVTGNMEGVYKINHGKLHMISEQQLVDCDDYCMDFPGTTQEVCDSGCNGGLMPNALRYATENGMMHEDDYQYTGRVGSCKFSDLSSNLHFNGWHWVEDSDEAMIAAINEVGPLSVAVDATYWSYYANGIYDGSCSSSRMNHGVLLVGYGTERGKDYWIVKNSWSPSWGENGFIRIVRNENKCGINNFVSTIVA